MTKNLSDEKVCEGAILYLISAADLPKRVGVPIGEREAVSRCSEKANVLSIIKRLKLSKSTGTSGLSAYPLRWIDEDVAVTAGEVMLQTVLDRSFPERWPTNKTTLLPKPRKDNTLLKKGRRGIYVAEQDREVAFGLLKCVYDEVADRVCAPTNPGWEKFRTATAQTNAIKSCVEQCLEERCLVLVVEDDKADFFMSIPYESQEIHEVELGVCKWIVEGGVASAWAEVAVVQHAYGSSVIPVRRTTEKKFILFDRDLRVWHTLPLCLRSGRQLHFVPNTHCFSILSFSFILYYYVSSAAEVGPQGDPARGGERQAASPRTQERAEAFVRAAR